MFYARFPSLRRLVGSGRFRAYDDDLALNLSFVLHERTTSETVQRAERAILRHKRIRHKVATVIVNGPSISQVDAWLTASLGAPASLERALHAQGYSPAPLCTIDQAASHTTGAEFFRAPANLCLPGQDVRQVGVASLVVRPGRRNHLLLVEGPFCWPDEQPATLRALEVMIQAHIEQWMPDVPLWPAPAEDLLGDEIR